MDERLSFFDAFSLFLSLYSIELAELNLRENREQSEHNDVSAANDKQASYMLEELGRKFDEQNAMLREILKELRDERNQGDS